MTHCALCTSYTTKDHISHKAVGLGTCKKQSAPGKFYPAGATSCESFVAGPNVAARVAFLRKFQGEAG